jgi:nitrate reductase delta subunit
MTDSQALASPLRRANPLRPSAFKKTPEHMRAVEAVQAWTRARFKLPLDAPVLVSQLTCSNPGCPPVQTVVAFWTETGERHHLKVLLPLEAIAENDIPPVWLDDAPFTEGAGGAGAGCC